MTDSEIDALTLGDLRRIAERATASAKAINEMRALFGAPMAPMGIGATPAPLQSDSLSLGRPPNSPETEAYLESIRGQREELVAQIRPPPKPPNPEDFPPDIAGAMRQS